MCFIFFILIIDVLRVGKLNVNGARELKKRPLVLDTARTNRIDVLFLQEVHSDPNAEVLWERVWEGRVFLSQYYSKWRSGHPALKEVKPILYRNRTCY